MSTDTHVQGTEIRDIVRERYGQSALKVLSGTGAASCCGTDSGSACCGTSATSGDPITSNLYVSGEAAEVPMEALLASLGCGNPTALARLNPGETVLDLGSGSGTDSFLLARKA